MYSRSPNTTASSLPAGRSSGPAAIRGRRRHGLGRSVWSRLGTGVGVGSGITGVYSLAVFDDELVVGGDFTRAGSESCRNIASWNGSSWRQLYGLSSPAFGMLPQNNELIVVGGFFTAGGIICRGTARWSGTAWAPLGNGAGPVLSIAVHDGHLTVGIRTGQVLRWDGQMWSPLGNGMHGLSNVGITTLATFNGDLIAGGEFFEADGVPASNIAGWDGESWSAFGTVGNALNDQAQAFAEHEGELIAAGRFITAGASTAPLVAAWNGVRWRSLEDGPGWHLHPGFRVNALIAREPVLVAEVFSQRPKVFPLTTSPIGTGWTGTRWARA